MAQPSRKCFKPDVRHLEKNRPTIASIHSFSFNSTNHQPHVILIPSTSQFLSLSPPTSYLLSPYNLTRDGEDTTTTSPAAASPTTSFEATKEVRRPRRRRHPSTSLVVGIPDDKLRGYREDDLAAFGVPHGECRVCGRRYDDDDLTSNDVSLISVETVGGGVVPVHQGAHRAWPPCPLESFAIVSSQEDPVLLTPEDSKEKPYVAILKDITETEGSLSVTGQWFYRPEEADKKGGGSWKASDTRELFYSFHIDDVPAESVMHKCVVHFIPQHKKIPSRKEHPGFIVQKVYDTVAKKLWNLTDKDYEDNKQHEIDLLVKKTIDRIGQLSDIEPADAPGDNNDQLSNKRGLRKRPVLPIDVSRDDALAGKSEQFGKAETPGSDKLKNYATLVKYKAVTGDQYRDRWLDKLVDTIPLTSKESARASHADPGGATKSSTNGSSAKEDNEKSYSPDVIVSIMASLERSTYEALGSDFQKYNQKLRQLLFNIKNSPVLRNRLMNKELDPPVLLTMSPDELKVGLTAAERTSEPEESRKLQLECNACGHSWFSSRDAITTLTVDTPTSAGGNVGTAPWATAKFDVMEKQLTSPRDHQPDKPLADALHKSTAPYMPTLEKQKSFGKHKPDEPSSAPAASHE
uniref:BAH domain-containing protein n=1 Tax=Oryza meridionalis TaxID=40149 RepID=A0A0E0C316_9ORYZ